MKIVIEILDESDDFTMDLLGWMERDRNAGSPISLETTNYHMEVRIVGIVGRPESTGYIIEPLDVLEGS